MSSDEKCLIEETNTYTKGQSELQSGSSIELRGTNNRVQLGDKVRGKLTVNIIGHNNQVLIADNVFMVSGLQIAIRRSNSIIRIGAGSTFQGIVRLSSHEPSSIEIGADCMFSSDIIASTSDVHAIYDQDNVRINPAQAIIIGDHVWIGNGVKLLKGVNIGGGSVVGMASVVTRGHYPENCILAGSPAKVVRENIRWTRDLP
jgi:acetyltransferase-like isoleucine patch superfamily enzyme